MRTEKQDLTLWRKVFNVSEKYWQRHGGSDHIIVMPAPVTNLRHQNGLRGFAHYMIHVRPEPEPNSCISPVCRCCAILNHHLLLSCLRLGTGMFSCVCYLRFLFTNCFCCFSTMIINAHSYTPLYSSI